MAPFGATHADTNQQNSSALTNESGPSAKTPPETPLKSSRGLPSPGVTTVQKWDKPRLTRRERRRRRRRNKRRAKRRKTFDPPSPPLLRTIQTSPPETGVLREPYRAIYDPRRHSAWWTSQKRAAKLRPAVDLLGRVYTDGAGRAIFPKPELAARWEINRRLKNVRDGKRAYTPKHDLTKEELHDEWRSRWRRPTPPATSIVVLGPASNAFFKGSKKVDVEVAFVKRIAIKNAMSAELSRG